MESIITLKNWIMKEETRQYADINLIASENYSYPMVRKIVGSCLSHKYSEGTVGKRYYAGNKFIDLIEEDCKETVLELFNAKNDYIANVQPLSGTDANLSVFYAVTKIRGKKEIRILSLDLSCGGHLSHGNKNTFTNDFFIVKNYYVNKETQLLDYDEIRSIALEFKPDLIISGASAYPRIIDFNKFNDVAMEVGALHLADIAHIAGLCCSGYHPSPVGVSDFIAFTTHKTLRGPRGAVILCRKEFEKQLNSAVFPGLHGGPHNNVVAAKSYCFKVNVDNSYKEYVSNVINNAKVMSREFINRGYKVITGGTDNHLLLVDIKGSIGIDGREAQELLEENNIIVNANSIPFDTSPPYRPSGIRLGSPFMTALDYKEQDFVKIVEEIDYILRGVQK